MKEALNRIHGLVVKEFLTLLQDKRARFVLVGPPLLQLFVFGYGATFDVNDIAVAVLNQDRGALSRQLVARFTGSRVFHRVAEPHQLQQAESLLTTGQADTILHIGPAFTQDLQRGQGPQVQVLVDGRNSNTAAIILQYARQIIQQFNETRLQGPSGRPSPVDLVVRSWFNPNFKSRWFIVPGLIGVLTLVVTTLVTALSVAREREAQTFDQLLVTPLNPFEILLGKAFPALVIGLAEATLMLSAAVFWFGIPFQGNLALLYLGLFLFMLSTVGIGLTISSLANTQQQALLGAFSYIIPTVSLSGFATPIANMPPLVQDITLLNPLRYCLITVRGVFLKDLGGGVLIHQFWPLAVIGSASLALAVLLFRRRTG